RAAARLEECRCARTTLGEHGAAGADRERTDRVRAGASVARTRTEQQSRELCLHHSLGWRGCGTGAERSGCARREQYGRRVRSRVAHARGTTLLVRCARLFGGVHIKPGDARALSWL